MRILKLFWHIFAIHAANVESITKIGVSHDKGKLYFVHNSSRLKEKCLDYSEVSPYSSIFIELI